MNTWSREREVEKPKPRKVATIEVWEKEPGMLTPPGTYRAQFVGTEYVGYGNTITAAVADMWERMLGGAIRTAVELRARGR